MGPVSLVCSLYSVFARHRVVLVGGVTVLLLVSALLFQRIRLDENIAAMLPGGQSEAARDFALLQEAPFARRMVISLRAASPGVEAATLLAAADRLAAALQPPWFSRVVAGAGDVFGGAALPRLLDALPNLLSESDLPVLAAGLTPTAVRTRLREGRERLLTPEGTAIKGLLRRDPLDQHGLALSKLRSLALIPGLTVRDRHFVSGDGTSVLVIAETPVAITDYRGARDLLDRLAVAAYAAVPQGITTTILSGHGYTLANAEAIRGDLALVIGLSSALILGIYVVFLRSWWAAFVFLVPASVLLIASGGVALLYPTVFAVTIGFGGVLLGMADEYAMHVFFALRKGGAPPPQILEAITRPVFSGGLATVTAFGVMLFSALPGQRQLAVFSIIGIVASVLLSLVVLPHLVPAGSAQGRRSAAPVPGHGRLPSRLVLAVWLGILALSGWGATYLQFNGDLRTMSFVSREIEAADREIRRAWGNLRSRAMVFADGRDLAAALRVNDEVYARLARSVPVAELVSLAPILPSPETQAENRRRWTAFWEAGRGRMTRTLLREAGDTLGFSPDAFAPFFDRLSRQPADWGPEDLRALGLGDLVDSLIIRGPQGWRVLTLVPDTPAVAALFPRGPADAPVHFVSPSRFRESVSRALGREFVLYIVCTFALVLALVVGVFREVRKVLLALVPVVTGLLFMLGGMGFLGMEFNLFNIVATVLIIGLSVDYGIFMVCHLSGGGEHAADRSVLVSGLTTLAGFGALVAGRHPAMHSIGLTVLLGFGAAIPAALLVIPALYRRACGPVSCIPRWTSCPGSRP